MTQSAPIYYDGRLSELLPILTAATRGCAPGIWSTMQVRQGFQVGLTFTEDGRRRIRVSTEDRPSGVRGWDRYREDRDRLRQHLAISHWQAEEVTGLSTSAVYAEPRVTA